ncbi:MAG: hypothetical protein ACRD2K_04145 [Terriglobales bacterium]
MLEVDRQIKATLLRSIPILVGVGMMAVLYHYWPKSGVVANPEAMREMQRIREEATTKSGWSGPGASPSTTSPAR